MTLLESAAMARLRRAKTDRNRARCAALEAALRLDQALQKRRRLQNAAGYPLPAAIRAMDAEIESAERAARVAGEAVISTEAAAEAARAGLTMIHAAMDQPAVAGG